MISKICDLDLETRVSLPQKEFTRVALGALRDVLEVEFTSERQRTLFIAIYPLLQDGGEWTPYKLFRELGKDPALAKTVKSHTSLLHHLEQLTKMGILRKLEGEPIRFALAELTATQMGGIEGVLRRQGFHEVLGAHYNHIYILTCTIARLLQQQHPAHTPERTFHLTRALLEIAVTFAVEDLAAKGVLLKQCANCLYPYPIEEGEHPRDDGPPDSLVPPQPADRPFKPDVTRPLTDQVLTFIQQKGGEGGMLEADILAAFRPFAQPADVREALHQLINVGGLYQPIPTKYQLVG